MKSLLTSTRLQIAAGILFIIITTGIAYAPVFNAAFIWDDNAHVTQNMALRSALGLKWIWLRPGVTPQYYPLTHTSFWIEYQLWGDNPRGYHLVNVALHVANGLILWRILALLGLRGAWVAGAIFALHPIEVESVAWVTERKNVLSACFYLTAALVYLYSLQLQLTWRRYVLSCALFICAVLSKTVAGSLPAALLLIIWWKTGRLRSRDILRLLPMFLIAIAMGIMTARMERTNVGAIGPEWDYSFVERCLIAARAIWFYLGKLLVPVNLTFIYPKWSIDAGSPWQWANLLAVIVMITTLFTLRKRIGRGPLVAMLFFLGSLIPALGFVNLYPMRFSFVADHFQYLAGIGIIALAAELLMRAISDSVRAVVIAIPLVLAGLTWRQCHMYQDSTTLWETTRERNPEAWIAHDHLGAMAAEEGDLAGAAGHYSTAMKLNPDHVEAYIGMVEVHLRARQFAAAVEQARRAIAIRPNKPAPYDALGRALAAGGDIDGAIEALREALRVDPKFVWSRIKLAELYRNIGRTGEAEEEMRQINRQIRDAFGYDSAPPIDR